MEKKYLILVEKNIVNKPNNPDYSPNFYIDFSDALKEATGEFLQDKWACYESWKYKNHFILLEQIGNIPSGHGRGFNNMFDLVHTNKETEEKLKRRAINYANEVKKKLFLEKGLETDVYCQVKNGNISISELAPVSKLEEIFCLS